MVLKSNVGFAFVLLLFFLVNCNASFIKGKNVPRVGRSNEAEGPFNHEMGYVIKTIPSKQIPRMGRRNYDSEKRSDLEKFYGTPLDSMDYAEEGAVDGYPEIVEPYYTAQMENMN